MQGYQQRLLFFALFITVTYADNVLEPSTAATDTVIYGGNVTADATNAKLVNIFCSFSNSRTYVYL